MDNKTKLRAILEAKRISRLKRDDQDDILDDLKIKVKRATGTKKEWYKILIKIIEENQDKADEDYNNMDLAYPVEGGVGYC